MIHLLLINAAGAFAIILGILHFTFPERFGFRLALSGQARPFRLGFSRFGLEWSNLYGVLLIMNHCISFTILSIGISDILARWWIGTAGGALLAGWIAGFWLLRAVTQLYLGRRAGDWVVVAWFTILGMVHLVATVL